MCRDLEAVDDARAVMLSVQETVCRRRLPDGSTAECPFYAACGYQKQKRRRHGAP